MIPQMTPEEAARTLASDADSVYLDVRTVPEYEAGHPAGAYNIPIIFLDEATHQPAPNREFARVVEATFAKAAKIIVGCQAGSRSQKAAEVMHSLGFTDVTNMQAGFGGARDGLGRVVEPGWRDLGLPVESGSSPNAGWDTLRQRS
ncbi:MAG: hypothetical protein QOD06_2715 [Candidatus Binatota bacterium]|nr:hypothetical protein [Candidatus Binatota bacterium]